MILLSTIASHADGPAFSQEVCTVIGVVGLLASALAIVICYDAHEAAHPHQEGDDNDGA